ncbi:phage major capsid protein [Actinomadura chokoriensis]|uniref:phage major capsid protein n=1 Tax=Actinomadura chokoriensis TaxID=454156 RepID=UPI0031F7BF3E
MPQMTAAEIERRIAEIGRELEALDQDAGNADLVGEARDRWDALATELEDLRTQRDAERAERLRQSRSRTGATRFGSGPDPVPSPDGTTGSLRSTALRQVEQAVRRGWLPGHGAERVSALLDAPGPDAERQAAALWAATAGHPAYRSAFAKLAVDPQRGHLEWTGEEQDAFRAVAEMRRRVEGRAGLTTSGYVLPVTVDPVVMLTNDGSASPLRSLAHVVTTVTSKWTGITSAGATAEWKPEGDEAADGTPAAAPAEIPVHSSDVDALFSYEVAQDGPDFLNQLTTVMGDALDNLWATGYTTGTGIGQPEGIITGLAGTASEITGGGTEALDDGDPYKLQDDLGARFSANAVFMSHIATANAFRQMETTNGALKFPELRQSPPMLLGKRWHENSLMDGVINPAVSEANRVLVYGDVRRGFVIVDRVGTSVEFLPAYGTDPVRPRPTAERHAFLFARTGSGVVVPEALRLLNVPTTA